MTPKFTAILAGSAAICLGMPALAQVTPEDVWQSWQKMGASYGQAIIADSVTRDGDTLVVTGMQISMDQDGVSMTGGIDEVRFRDVGDGSVEVTMTDTYAIDLSVVSESQSTQDISIRLTQPGTTLLAAGNATKTDYTYTAPSVVMEMVVSENSVQLADIDATLTGIAGQYVLDTQTESSLLESTLSIDDMAFAVTAGEAGSTAHVIGDLAALNLTSRGAFLGVAAMEDMAQALRDGFTADVDLSFGAGSYSVEAEEAGKITKLSATNETGHFRVGMGTNGLRYGAGGTGVDMTISGDDIPFRELTLAYKEAAFDLAMPLLASEAVSDFSFLTRIVDLTMSNEIWSMFDPTVALPRDPATVIIDTKGKVRLTTDLVDEAAMAALEETPPGELHALDVSDLTLRFAGAELTGTGAMTFDNSDTATFDGVPAPTGKIDLVIRGGNGFLDKLVAMGVIPQDQAMGARMMMAIIAKPGDGPDVLNSSLEFRDKGFYANGQRLR